MSSHGSHHMEGSVLPRGESNAKGARKRLSARHTLRIVIRNSIYAALGRIVIGVIKLIAKKGIGRTFMQRLPGEVLSLDPLKWAAVFGGISSFRLCMQTVSRIGIYLHAPPKLSACISGCLCSLPVLVMNKETRTELALYALVRAMHTFCLRFIYPVLPRWMQRFEHYDVLMMCVSSSQISYSCVYAPYTMPRTYQQFLVKASAYDERLIRAHSGFLRKQLTPEFVDYCAESKLAVLNDFSSESAKKFCEYVHPGLSCNASAIRFILKSIVYMGIPLYGPLRIVTTLATQRKKLMAHPARTITRGAKAVFTSSLFLALYSGCIIRNCCTILHAQGRGEWRIAVLSFFAGFATLLEPKGRRMDLALYCSMYALRSFVLTQNRLGHLPYPKHWFVLLTYFASTTFMFYEYEEESKLLNPRVRSAFRLLLGEKTASTKHQHDEYTVNKHCA